MKKFLPGIAWFFILLVLLCIPGDDLPSTDNWMKLVGLDKWVHAFLFGMLAFLFMKPILKSGRSIKEKWLYVVLIAIATSIWGLTTEFIQRDFITGRSFELFDWVADTLGAGIALIIARKYYFPR